MEHPIAVLVSREGLGDALLKLPLLRAIARGFPGRPIWWLAAYQTAMAGVLREFLPAEVAEVREYLGFDKPRAQAARRLGELRPFSLVFDTRSGAAGVWSAWRHLSYDAFYCSLPGYLLSSRRPRGRLLRPRHIGQRAFSLAESAFGAAADGGGRLECSSEAAELAHALLPSEPASGPVYIGLAPGSRETHKNWPAERFLELASDLRLAGLVPVFLIGPKEQQRAAELRQSDSEVILVEFMRLGAGIGSLDAAIAVLRRLSVVVANDSGLGHLAGAAGRPVVSLFGPTDPRRWAPFAPRHRWVRAQRFGGEAMALIEPAAVLAAVRELLAEPSTDLEAPR
ncbi:MAG TPA: glycosyltransferase family 9 protein [Candidatus Udaeobacter sp.]|nr:glycosyltransferase family 9 protein [Candidatus Udaeobacter sp.]